MFVNYFYTAQTQYMLREFNKQVQIYLISS